MGAQPRGCFRGGSSAEYSSGYGERRRKVSYGRRKPAEQGCHWPSATAAMMVPSLDAPGRRRSIGSAWPATVLVVRRRHLQASTRHSPHRLGRTSVVRISTHRAGWFRDRAVCKRQGSRCLGTYCLAGSATKLPRSRDRPELEQGPNGGNERQRLIQHGMVTGCGQFDERPPQLLHRPDFLCHVMGHQSRFTVQIS